MMGKEHLWTGAVDFVLVSIPVELAPAVHEQRIAFRLLHESDNALLQRQMYCRADDRFVHAEHIVNGYEVEPERYVVVTDEEYEALEPQRSQAISIDSFIDFEEIDPVYFDRPYYLVPRAGGERSYRLLVEVMQEKHKAALGRFVLHNKEHLVALWAGEQVLNLMMLHFPEQVMDREELRPQDVQAQPAKVKAISAVMRKLKGQYDPAQYVDEHRRQVLDYLHEKAGEQGTVVAAGPEEAEEQPVEQEEGRDLVAALEESLARTRAR